VIGEHYTPNAPRNAGHLTCVPLKRKLGDFLGGAPHSRARPGVLSKPCHIATSDSNVALLWREQEREVSVVGKESGGRVRERELLLGFEFLSLAYQSLMDSSVSSST
jgi:hypothetical protein